MKQNLRCEAMLHGSICKLTLILRLHACRQLKTVAPQHAAVLRTAAAEEAFDRAAASFGSSAA